MTKAARQVDLDTYSFSTGPITLDCVMARDQGWTDEMLERAALAIETIARDAAKQVAIKCGYSHKCPTCECWTVPPPKPCHLCAADADAHS